MKATAESRRSSDRASDCGMQKACESAQLASLSKTVGIGAMSYGISPASNVGTSQAPLSMKPVVPFEKLATLAW
jgi:hypothetical protein